MDNGHLREGGGKKQRGLAGQKSLPVGFAWRGRGRKKEKSEYARSIQRWISGRLSYAARVKAPNAGLNETGRKAGDGKDGSAPRKNSISSVVQNTNVGKIRYETVGNKYSSRPSACIIEERPGNVSTPKKFRPPIERGGTGNKRTKKKRQRT